MDPDNSSLDFYFLASFYALLTYIFYQYAFSYFTKKNIPVLNPKFPFGNIKKALKPKKPRYEYFQELYARFRIRCQKHGGIYLFFKPVYMPVDLDYIRNILTKDFDYFSDRGLYYNKKCDRLSANLLSLEGNIWKELRVKTTPIFSSKSIKNFVVNFVNTSKNMLDYIEENKAKSIDVKVLSDRYNLDIAANNIFGIDLNSFVQEYTILEKHSDKIFKSCLYNTKILILTILFPKISKLLSTKVFSQTSTKYFTITIRSIIEFRAANQIKKNDFLQLMLDEKLTHDEIAAQCLLFVLLGNKPSSNLMSFCMYELAKNPEVQEKLRNEIFDVLKRRESLDYETVAEMTYLNQVIDETLRMYPPIPMILRKCTKDYPLPDGKEYLDKGTSVLISILGIHMDENNYENPKIFDPDRFTEENKAKRHPFAFIPFGEGHRMCPAMKFSILQIKVGLIKLMMKYKFDLSRETKGDKGLVLSKKVNVMTSKNPIFVRFVDV